MLTPSCTGAGLSMSSASAPVVKCHWYSIACTWVPWRSKHAHLQAIGRRKLRGGQQSVFQEQLCRQRFAGVCVLQIWSLSPPRHSVWTAAAALATPQPLAVAAQ